MKNQSMGLIHTVLKSARLDNADLRKADLSRAELQFASLKKSDLTGALLRGADLSGADLTEATVSGVDFFGADLASTRLVAPVGLEAARNFDKAINRDRLLQK
jgi:uncharacterized protein YjbI with pentapeptide repeats